MDLGNILPDFWLHAIIAIDPVYFYGSSEATVLFMNRLTTTINQKGYQDSFKPKIVFKTMKNYSV